MGTCYIPVINLAQLKFTNNSLNYVVDSNDNFSLSQSEAIAGIPSGQSYATVKSVDILPACKSVGLQAFRNYPGYDWNPVEGLTFSTPSNVESIGEMAFSNWTSSSPSGDLVIPSKVQTIGDSAFSDWGAMSKSLDLSNATSLKTIGVKSFAYWSSANTVSNPFSGYYDDSPITIPSNVETIGNYAFSSWDNMFGMLKFESPSSSSLKTIGSYAFHGWINSGNLGYFYDYAVLTIPSSVNSIGSYAFGSWSTIGGGVEFSTPTSLNVIPYGSFYGWEGCVGKGIDITYNGSQVVNGINITSTQNLFNNAFTYPVNPYFKCNVSITSRGISQINMYVSGAYFKLVAKNTYYSDNSGSWKNGFGMWDSDVRSDIQNQLKSKTNFPPSLISSLMSSLNVYFGNDVSCQSGPFSYNYGSDDPHQTSNGWYTDDNSIYQATAGSGNNAQAYHRLRRDSGGLYWEFKWSGMNGCSSGFNLSLQSGNFIASSDHGGNMVWTTTSYPCGDSRPSCDTTSGGSGVYYKLDGAINPTITYTITKPLVIPYGITEIGDYAFYNWKNYKGKIILGDTIETIGERAFFYWQASEGYGSNIADDGILIFGSKLTSIKNKAFNNLGAYANAGQLEMGGYHTIKFNTVTPPTFGGGVFGGIAYNRILVDLKVLVPSGANLSAWKAALNSNGGNGDFESINGTPWASIP